jgi:PqqD family protein of HPr-rel-A system
VATDVKWRTVTEFGLLQRSWGDEGILYHTGSGDTHQLNPLATEVLQALQRTPTTVKDLIGQLATRFDISRENELEDVLAKLERHGIIERVHS